MTLSANTSRSSQNRFNKQTYAALLTMAGVMGSLVGSCAIALLCYETIKFAIAYQYDQAIPLRNSIMETAEHQAALAESWQTLHALAAEPKRLSEPLAVQMRERLQSHCNRLHETLTAAMPNPTHDHPLDEASDALSSQISAMQSEVVLFETDIATLWRLADEQRYPEVAAVRDAADNDCNRLRRQHEVLEGHARRMIYASATNIGKAARRSMWLWITISVLASAVILWHAGRRAYTSMTPPSSAARTPVPAAARHS